MTGGTYDIGTNQLTLTFSRPVLATLVGSAFITLTGNLGHVRTNAPGGSFGSSSSHVFATTGASVASDSFLTVDAPSGIPSIVDASNGTPVDPFTGLRIDLS